MLDKKWEDAIEKVNFAFQPIIDINSGETVAFEALLRDYQDGGFSTIDQFFDTAYSDKVLFDVDLYLRKKVLKSFQEIYKKNNKILLFYNLDNRIVEMDNYTTGHTENILKELKYINNIITFEISEKHEFKSFLDAKTIFNLYSEQGYKVAIDDFGTGYSGLKMLYHFSPDFIKIDRFFITDILNDDKKKIFVSNIVNIAHYSNITVIAEGIETLEELDICNEIGCDLIQGYYIQKPTQDLSKLQLQYKVSRSNNNRKKAVCNTNFNLDNIYYTSNAYNSLIDKYIISSATNLKGEITSVSSAFAKISGYSKQELIGKSHNIVRDPLVDKEIFKELWSTIKNNQVWQGEISNKAKDGSIYWVDATVSPNYDNEGNLIGYTSIRIDITDRKKLEYFSNIDQLTGAYNKKYFNKELQNTIDLIVNTKKYLTLAIFDIDNFEAYNNTYGHNKGDKAIKEVAKTTFEVLGKEQYLFRIGGDAFAVILLNYDKKKAQKKLEKLLQAVEDKKIKHPLNKPLSKYLTISCGAISIQGEQIKNNSNLFVNADILLYQAKNNSKNKLVISNKIYNSSLNLIIDKRT